MARGKISDFLNRMVFQDEDPEETGGHETTQQQNLTEGDETAEFVTPTLEEGDEDVSKIAQKIIEEAQQAADEDEYPDIRNVQSVLDNVGADADHEVIRNILKNLIHCNPDDLEKDGIARKQAILDAIERVKQQATALKTETANDEQTLQQQEEETKKACTERISQAKAESDKAIEEEKARSAAVIAEIISKTAADTEEVEKERDATLAGFATMRAQNEAAVQRATNLAAQIESQGQRLIEQIDQWLGYLK